MGSTKIAFKKPTRRVAARICLWVRVRTVVPTSVQVPNTPTKELRHRAANGLVRGVRKAHERCRRAHVGNGLHVRALRVVTKQLVLVHGIPLARDRRDVHELVRNHKPNPLVQRAIVKPLARERWHYQAGHKHGAGGVRRQQQVRVPGRASKERRVLAERRLRDRRHKPVQEERARLLEHHHQRAVVRRKGRSLELALHAGPRAARRASDSHGRRAQLGHRGVPVIGRVEDAADQILAQCDRGGLADVVGHGVHSRVQPRRHERVEGHLVERIGEHALGGAQADRPRRLPRGVRYRERGERELGSVAERVHVLGFESVGVVRFVAPERRRHWPRTQRCTLLRYDDRARRQRAHRRRAAQVSQRGGLPHLLVRFDEALEGGAGCGHRREKVWPLVPVHVSARVRAPHDGGGLRVRRAREGRGVVCGHSPRKRAPRLAQRVRLAHRVHGRLERLLRVHHPFDRLQQEVGRGHADAHLRWRVAKVRREVADRLQRHMKRRRFDLWRQRVEGRARRRARRVGRDHDPTRRAELGHVVRSQATAAFGVNEFVHGCLGLRLVKKGPFLHAVRNRAGVDPLAAVPLVVRFAVRILDLGVHRVGVGELTDTTQVAVLVHALAHPWGAHASVQTL